MKFQHPIPKLQWTLLGLVPGALVISFILLLKAGAVGDYPIIRDLYLALCFLWFGATTLAFGHEGEQGKVRFWLEVVFLALLLAATLWSFAENWSLWIALLAA